MVRRLSRMYRVAQKLRSIDPELPRPMYKDYNTSVAPAYSAVPQGNSQDLLINNDKEQYVIVGNEKDEFVILDYK